MPLSSLLYSVSGAGKSYLLSTAPGPILVAETGGKEHLFPRATEQWDPTSGVFPKVTKDSITVVPIATLADLTAVVNAVQQPAAPWKTLGLDSFTVLVRIGERELINDNARDGRQEYKKLYNYMEQEVLIPLKNVTSRSDRTLENLVLTAWQDPARVTPYITGSVKLSVDYMFDIMAHVEMTFDNGKIGNTMHIMPTPGYHAKAPGTLYVKYGPKIINPDLTKLSNEIATKETA